jgi:excisionase family DNA binding protein
MKLEKNLYRVDEVATILGVARSTVYLWIDHGILTASKIRGVIRVEKDAILKVVKKNKIKPFA